MNPTEARRFQRVHFRTDFGPNDRIVKAKVFWRNLEGADVFDLSFGGLAASRPGLLEIKPNDVVDLTLELGDLPAFDVKAKVAWAQDFTIGLSFLDIGPEGHLQLRKFLTDKLVGASLVLVEKHTYPKDNPFDFWYSGPRGTHVFISLSEAQTYPMIIRRAEVDLDGDRLIVDGDKLIATPAVLESTIQVLSHAPENYVELHFLLELLTKLKVRSHV